MLGYRRYSGEIMIELTERHANIPHTIASNYELSRLPTWIAEDFVGFLTLVLVQAWRRYDPTKGASLDTHLFGSVQLAAKGYWSKFRFEKRLGLLLEHTLPMDWLEASFEDHAKELIEVHDLCKNLEARLPPDQWRLLKLYHIEQKPLREILVGTSHYLALKRLREAEQAAKKILRGITHD